jgi:hypothetical protein
MNEEDIEFFKQALEELAEYERYPTRFIWTCSQPKTEEEDEELWI